MNHNIIVQPNDDGIRPAGPQDECFYCRQPIGQLHGPECAAVHRKALVRFSFDIPVEVPAHWDDEQIEFHYGEGSWCASNTIDLLAKVNPEGCLCHCFSSEYLKPISKFPYGKLKEPPK